MIQKKNIFIHSDVLIKTTLNDYLSLNIPIANFDNTNHFKKSLISKLAIGIFKKICLKSFKF